MGKEKRIKKAALEFQRFEVRLARFFIYVAIIDILVLVISVIFWYADGMIWSILGLFVCTWFIVGGHAIVIGADDIDAVVGTTKKKKIKKRINP